MAKVDDIRIGTDIFESPKIRKLIRHKGDKGFITLIKLWMWIARNRSDGILTGMEAEDIMDVAGTNDETFITYLEEINLIQYNNGIYEAHEWGEHQPWAFDTTKRVKSAKKAAEIRWKTANQQKKNSRS